MPKSDSSKGLLQGMFQKKSEIIAVLEAENAALRAENIELRAQVALLSAELLKLNDAAMNMQ